MNILSLELKVLNEGLSVLFPQRLFFKEANVLNMCVERNISVPRVSF